MNEFIVWYKNKDTNKVFSREFNLNQLILQIHLEEICDSPGCVDYEILCILPSIGKADISGNKIYADCSIVEIGFSWQKSKDRIKGYFIYDNVALSCVIWNIDKNDYIDFDLTKMQYFKIIDTIQENKLGLIK